MRGVPFDRYVYIGNTDSSTMNITHGIPQQSVLDTLLFFDYINDSRNASSKFLHTLFADDITLTYIHIFNKHMYIIFINSTSEDAIIQLLTNEIVNIDRWLNANKIRVNHTKSRHIIFFIVNI